VHLWQLTIQFNNEHIYTHCVSCYVENIHTRNNENTLILVQAIFDKTEDPFLRQSGESPAILQFFLENGNVDGLFLPESGSNSLRCSLAIVHVSTGTTDRSLHAEHTLFTPAALAAYADLSLARRWQTLWPRMTRSVARVSTVRPRGRTQLWTWLTVSLQHCVKEMKLQAIAISIILVIRLRRLERVQKKNKNTVNKKKTKHSSVKWGPIYCRYLPSN